MANIKSAKKRILIDRRNAERNKAVKSTIKTAVKKVYAAIDANDKEAAKSALNAATVEISKAASKGILHKKTASRKISRLSLAVNKID
ncbi:MAG: 30S ribosomal protein S20 [Lachnospiraceae bacterium]|nr:30S ribosomal protein S20 [Lachnospiraceae bacterium]